MTTHQITDPDAKMQILSGDGWGPWMMKTLQKAEKSVFMSIYMVSPHWRVPNRFKLDLLATLQGCAERGLTCRAIIASPKTIKTRDAYNAEAARELLQAGWKVKMMEGARLLHEKFMLVDNRIAVIGSHNLSKASLTSNHDTSIAIESEALAKEVHTLFWERWRTAIKAE